MKILNFGSCNIDSVYQLDHITQSGETNRAFSLLMYPGGKGLNQSVALSKAGSRIYHAGAIGSDGEWLRSFMKENDVCTDYLRTVEGNTGNAIIQVDKDGNNAIIILNGANYGITREQIDGVLSDFGEGDILTLQNEISNVSYLVDAAWKKGMTVYFNPSPFNERCREVELSHVSCLVVNEVEAAAICPFRTEKEFLSAMRERCPGLRVLLTLGGKGSVYLDENGTLPCPAFKVDAVDTTAAGDTFTGYFIHCMSNGFPVRKALETASCAAALAVSKKGAASSIPCMAEVRKALRELPICQPERKDMLSGVTRYIRNNLTDACLSGAAGQLGYSENYIGKAIRKQTGKSFSDLLCGIRVEIAANLLLTTDLRISEIIAAVGYTNESYFRKHFTAVYGKTPLAYRNGK